MQDIGMLQWQGLGPYIHNSQYVPPFVQIDSSIPILLCGDFNKNRIQLLLRLAFAMTINNAQGQTFARVSLLLQVPLFTHGQLHAKPLLQEPVFTHGQLYVAFSSVPTLDSIHVKLTPCIYKTRRMTRATPGFTRLNPYSQKNASTPVKLKIGAIVMLLRSFNPKQGLCKWYMYGDTVHAWKKCNRNIPDAAKSLQGRLHFKITVWKAFKEGREEVADEPSSGRPITARTDKNVDRVLEVLRTDRPLSIQQIADTLHMSTFVVHGIVTEDLQMRKVCAKFVPKVLTQDQKELRVLRCQELLDLLQNEPGFLNSVVTRDESWMFEYDQKSKRQSCAWHKKSSPRHKKARMSKSRIKTMIIVFFDIRGIVHCEFVPQGQTVNSAFYLEVLRRLTDIKDTVKLYHDNATSHTAFIITNFLARSNTPVIPHPPYSLDLAPCDFFLFPRLKREMKGKHWETVENIQHHVTTFLRSIPVEEFQGAFQVWQTRLRKCIDAGGMYFEENRTFAQITINKCILPELSFHATFPFGHLAENPPSDINIPFILKRQEFPLRLVFPMTINKAQGQTFARVGLLLQEPVFMHEQLDVAFSRVRTLDSIHVKVNPCMYKTKNLVFNEVL
ncbi:hypothetical protein LAZ67_16002005 [Cordylochernes scorpioides]|uniref:ATP-dependent DNA helicase n=1 Tax=Cordylochernes scorpioides TaxID=51811 RepID=A0ABY6LBZ1_9ARAC|nr:hypothetical protein LAZ67_16002005 [Cordylochernes scorpioides]